MVIKVLGSGCPSCKTLHERVKEVVSEDKDIKVEYITDISVILEEGIMSTPALMIDEKVVCTGRVPSQEEIEEYINGDSEEIQSSNRCSCGGCC